MGGTALLVLLPLAKATSLLLVIALTIGSLLGSPALVHGQRPRSSQDLAVVTLGWLGAITMTVYAAPFWLQ
jgi:hypothetical protein